MKIIESVRERARKMLKIEDGHRLVAKVKWVYAQQDTKSKSNIEKKVTFLAPLGARVGHLRYLAIKKSIESREGKKLSDKGYIPVQAYGFRHPRLIRVLWCILFIVMIVNTVGQSGAMFDLIAGAALAWTGAFIFLLSEECFFYSPKQ